MAIIIQAGPRLGPPVDNGLTAWVMLNQAAEVKLQVRKTGTTTWIDGTSDNAVVSNAFTARLAAPNLQPGTSYDWRILAADPGPPTDSDQKGSIYTVYTMPNSGRFIVYQVSDNHTRQNLELGMDVILADYTTNYQPLGIPAILMCYGDLWTPGLAGCTSVDTAAEASVNIANFLTLAVSFWPVVQIMPFITMFDDWDWDGNDGGSYWGFFDSRAVAPGIQSIMFGDRPKPVSTSYSCSLDIADVPFLFLDERSEKFIFDLTDFSKNTGTEQGTLWSETTKDYLRGQLTSWYDRAMVVVVSGGTFMDTNRSSNDYPFRDSISITHKRDQVDVMEAAKFLGSKNALVVWSGDDHTNRVDGTMVVGQPQSHVVGARNAGPGASYWEFKTTLIGPQIDALGAAFIPDVTNKFYLVDGVNFANGAFVRWDITSTNNGANVTARAQYIGTADNNLTFDPGDLLTDYTGRLGDFTFTNGVWQTTDTDWSDSTMQNQLYPPENGFDASFSFTRWYPDDINGIYHREPDITRDFSSRRRFIEDFGDIDRDDLLEGWTIRSEENPDEP